VCVFRVPKGGISPGGAQRRLMLSAEQRIISLLAFPFIDFALKNVPVTDEKLEKYGGDAQAFIQFRPFLPRSQNASRAGDGAAALSNFYTFANVIIRMR
jgi:hypothetical protein